MAGGITAKRYGQLFESVFAAQCARQGVATTRMPDGCHQVGANRLIRVATPWDWILTLDGRTALIDTKTLGEKRFPHARVVPHQIREMVDHERAGAIAGYVIWLRAIDQVIFAPASTLSTMVPRGSLGPADHDSLASLVTNLGPSANFDVTVIFKRFDPAKHMLT